MDQTDAAAHGFSIGVLASRTGVTPGVLRTWENRFGFPAGERSDSGHRRFTEADVDLVRRVLDARDSGLPLRAAIEAVARSEPEPLSAYSAAAEAAPEVRPVRMGRRALIAASHAVEDECLARGERAVVLGAFQLGHNFSRSAHRWEELGRTAAWAGVVADFGDDLPADPAATPARCQLAADSPLRREWTVVCLSASYAAVVAAWQVPAAPGTRPAYESVLSTHRGSTVAAARALAAAMRQAGARLPDVAERLLDPATPSAPTQAIDADRTWLRALAEMDPR